MRLPIAAARIRRQLGSLRGYVSRDRHGDDIVRRGSSPDCERPVLLLYGLVGSRRVYQVLEHRLRRDGFGVWSLRLGGLFDAFSTRGIDESAERLAEQVERLYARHPLGPLAIVGYSLGGLVARYYVKRLGGDRRVRSLVTLGTPHHGTPTAYLGAAAMGVVSPSLRQVTPMSRFIRRLKIGGVPPAVRMVSVYSKSDRICPFPCCILETENRSNLRNVEVPGVGHLELVISRRVYEVVRGELSLAFRSDDEPAPVARFPHLVGS